MAEDIAHLLPLLEEKGGIYYVCDSYQPTFGEISASVVKQFGKQKLLASLIGWFGVWQKWGFC